MDLVVHTNRAILSCREGDKVMRLWQQSLQPFLELPEIQKLEGSSMGGTQSGEESQETGEGRIARAKHADKSAPAQYLSCSSVHNFVCMCVSCGSLEF